MQYIFKSKQLEFDSGHSLNTVAYIFCTNRQYIVYTVQFIVSIMLVLYFQTLSGSTVNQVHTENSDTYS